MSREELPLPHRIAISPEGVTIDWADGHTSLYPHRYLRLRCACAGCVGEWPHTHSLDEASIPQWVEVLDYLEVGRYALQFLFSDGHSTGIYPFRTLREACPCPVCQTHKKEEQSRER
ncbi:MAG: DUF971 domain-containing protein [Dehalococcoidia bacterium]